LKCVAVCPNGSLKYKIWIQSTFLITISGNFIFHS
jgi:hypothetical protein